MEFRFESMIDTSSMNTPTAYHQIGQFIVSFQRLESAVSELIELLADTDGTVVRILVNDLEYSRRLNAADVLFARFVDLRSNTRAEAKPEFHKLMVELRTLGERRNDLVHSRYIRWVNVDGDEGLLRSNSRLRAGKGERQETEEELQPQAFDDDLQRLSISNAKLEKFRLEVIDWLHPEE
jgi:hypothetical protein